MSNQDENKKSPVAEVASFLLNGELKETVPSIEKKQGVSSVASRYKEDFTRGSTRKGSSERWKEERDRRG